MDRRLELHHLRNVQPDLSPPLGAELVNSVNTRQSNQNLKIQELITEMIHTQHLAGGQRRNQGGSQLIYYLSGVFEGVS